MPRLLEVDFGLVPQAPFLLHLLDNYVFPLGASEGGCEHQWGAPAGPWALRYARRFPAHAHLPQWGWKSPPSSLFAECKQ